MTSAGTPAGKSAHERDERFADDESVMRYLREHPEFFARHPRLLAELSLPHEAGTAVSLIERQVTLLRERNIDTRKRLAQLVEVAHTNDGLFEKTRHLTLLLLDSRTLDDIDHALGVGLLESFGADHVACHFVFTGGRYRTGEADGRGNASSGRHMAAHHLVAHRDTATLPLAQTLRGENGVTCGAIRAEEYHALFGVSDGHASAAIVAFTRDGVRGLLAVGSHDPIRFSSDMGPLFVRYVGDVVCRVLHRALTAGRD